jgi:hypothetical protein
MNEGIPTVEILQCGFHLCDLGVAQLDGKSIHTANLLAIPDPLPWNLNWEAIG